MLFAEAENPRRISLTICDAYTATENANVAVKGTYKNRGGSLFSCGVQCSTDRAMYKPATVVSVDELGQEPYAFVLCFPKPTEDEIQSRLFELRSLGVSALEFVGKANVYGVPVPVLGKGFVGIVVIAYLQGERVAVKIRRVDADRADLLHEAQMLAKANSANVAPKLRGASKNFLVMQLIDGDILPTWLQHNGEKEVVQGVLRRVLEQCFRLDQIGLDHGELSKAPKHVIVDRQLEPWIVDFESSSDARKPANVSAMGNFLFTSQSEVARQVAKVIGERDKAAIVGALKNYKKSRTKEAFEAAVQACLE
ncbi:MAG: serine/threonine protein kinase [Candidatus Bathyarchaeota archaeon]|nr:serine/threonine protein kinase [Candidatus Bathyarchaeota archaeon]